MVSSSRFGLGLVGPIVQPPDLLGLMPLTRYSSTSSTSGRDVDRDQRGALARLDRAVLGVESERRGALPRRAVEQRRGRHAPAPGAASSPARRTRSGPRRSPGCRCRPRRARRTRRSRSIGGAPAPVWPLLRGQVTSVAPRAASRARSAVGHLHAVHGEHARVEEAAVVEILHRAARPAASTPDPTRRAPRAASRHGPPPVADELDLLRRLRQMDAARRERRRDRRLADRAEHAAARPSTARARPGWRARGRSARSASSSRARLVDERRADRAR